MAHLTTRTTKKDVKTEWAEKRNKLNDFATDWMRDSHASRVSIFDPLSASAIRNSSKLIFFHSTPQRLFVSRMSTKKYIYSLSISIRCAHWYHALAETFVHLMFINERIHFKYTRCLVYKMRNATMSTRGDKRYLTKRLLLRRRKWK